MHEIIEHSIRMVNLPFTALLGLVIVYWLLVIIGALDMDLFSHGSADLDHHVEGHHGHHGHHESGVLTKVLQFAWVGEVPVTFVLSMLSLCMWMASMTVNYYLPEAGFLAFAFLIPNFLVSLIVSRYLVYPFRPLFRVLMKDRDGGEEPLGNMCRITSLEATGEFGQAEITTKGAPVIINVRTMADAVIPKGAMAVVVREDREKRMFYIAELPEHSKKQSELNS